MLVKGYSGRRMRLVLHLSKLDYSSHGLSFLKESSVKSGLQTMYVKEITLEQFLKNSRRGTNVQDHSGEGLVLWILFPTGVTIIAETNTSYWIRRQKSLQFK